jgi:ubiquinone/menaquinone biosynthesis C-methylase UbiE
MPLISGKPNAQYKLAAQGSLSSRLIERARRRMFELFMREIAPQPAETVLDLGVSSDRTYAFSNYFEALYPWKRNITAAGLDDARFLETLYPGLRFEFADAVDLPFPDQAFDVVHSSAVIEHVGSPERQAKMVAECLRVARRAVCLTTPNRWFPIEVHTQLPLLHWLPPALARAVFRHAGYGFFADEANLNLMTKVQSADIMSCARNWGYRFAPMRLFGFTSNIVLVARREA